MIDERDGAPKSLIRELTRVMKLLKPLETNECPFKQRPKTNERPHWVRPELVAQIKFTEWTADGKLRHPVYLGLRDDKKPHDVRREEKSRFTADSTRRLDSRASAGLVGQLRAIEDSRRDGVLELPDGDRLNVSKSAPSGGYDQRYTFGLDYWINPSTVVKIAYEIDDREQGRNNDAFFIQGAMGF